MRRLKQRMRSSSEYSATADSELSSRPVTRAETGRGRTGLSCSGYDGERGEHAVTDAGGQVGGAVASQVVQALLGALAQAARDHRQRRRRAAADVFRRLRRLRKLLLHAETERDRTTWIRAITKTFDTIDQHQELLPPATRHLKRSLRAALGEAVGAVAAADLDTVTAPLAAFDRQWAVYGGDYIEYLLTRLAPWHSAYSNRRAEKAAALTYDEWLQHTDRYHPGAGVPKPPSPAWADKGGR